MAARKRLTHTQRTRDRIQTSMLIQRLEKFVKGDVEMNAAQVSAALGLMKKTLPDLATVQLTGDEEGGPVKVSVIELTAPK